jgi:hypothetical protein
MHAPPILAFARISLFRAAIPRKMPGDRAGSIHL